MSEALEGAWVTGMAALVAVCVAVAVTVAGGEPIGSAVHWIAQFTGWWAGFGILYVCLAPGWR